MMRRRLLLCVILVVATGTINRLAATPAAKVVDLSVLPMTIGGWRGEEAPPLDDDTVRLLGADSYVNRTYVAGTVPVSMYVAFYAGQKPGDSIHSPLNCLPGTGWEPMAVSTMAIVGATGKGGEARRIVVRKDDRQALVLYWYQLHGRMVANEWFSKLYLLADSVRLRRSDAALVRIVVPMAGSASAAEGQAVSFARAMMPSLDRLWSQ